MYCRNCGKEVSETAEICVNCGAPPKKGVNYCQNCGTPTDPIAEFCTKCGIKLASEKRKSWLAALLLSLFVGSLGVDRFYLGYIGLGILKLLTLGGCGIWSLIDFILIATDNMTDAKGRPLLKD